MKINPWHLGVLSALILAAGCTSNSSKLKSMIGKEYQTLAEFNNLLSGYEQQEGMLIESYNDNEYGLAHYIKGPFNVIVFERVVRKENGKVGYVMLDVLEIKCKGKNQNVSCGLCRVQEKNDTDIIAVYQVKDNVAGFCKNIKKAWKANRKTEKFERTDTNGIACIHEG